MSTAPEVSIVVIAYRAADTIERAVRSALAQTEHDLEVVVVDDGSDDGTRELVLDLARVTGDERLRIADAAENAGPSAARNRGIALARGRWIMFLDSDDAYEPTYVETMMRAAERAPDCDLVLGGHVLVPADGGEERERRAPSEPGAMSGREAALRLLEDRLTPYVWDKAFRRETLGADPFPAGVHRAEDAIAVLGACLRARRVVVIREALYRYVVSPTSLTWGRVAPVEESDELMRCMAVGAAPLLAARRARRGLSLSRSLTYVNSAHQAIARLPEAERRAFVRACGRRIPWSDVLASLRVRPAIGAAALGLKALPPLYTALYRAYIRRAYALG